ncbi:MAG: rod shape-determining protein MreD [Chloroflexota bacterium]|jgi:rod shape-determining protein MreD
MVARRVSLMLLLLAIAAIAQTIMVSSSPPVFLKPDLVLLVVVTHSVVRGVEEGALAGLIGGLMVDCLSTVPFGAATFAMGVLGLATGLGEDNIFRANVIIPLVAVFLATIFYHSFLLLSLQGGGWRVEWLGTLALQTVPSALLNALLAPMAIPVIRRITASPEEAERMRW